MTDVSIPYEKIISLWYDGLEIRQGQEFPMQAMMRWFRATEEFDEKCREYDGLIRQLVTLPFEKITELASTPQKSLPVIILLDQISRNINRGPRLPFVYSTIDPVAIKLSHWCLLQGHDAAHPPFKKLWYYMPLQHSESLADQELGLSKNALNAYEIRNSEWKEMHPFASRGLGHGVEFYKTIARFGRFPFRNQAMGRESTAEEIKFLEEGGGSFTVVNTGS